MRHLQTAFEEPVAAEKVVQEEAAAEQQRQEQEEAAAEQVAQEEAAAEQQRQQQLWLSTEPSDTEWPNEEEDANLPSETTILIPSDCNLNIFGCSKKLICLTAYNRQAWIGWQEMTGSH